MIHVNFDPANLTGQRLLEWQQWMRKAADATKVVITQWETWLAGPRDKPFDPTFDEKIWSELKAWMFKHVFNKKCAYCETRAVRFSYHAEHYRPKGAVTFAVEVKKKRRLRTATCVDDKGTTVPHPGYFWLAYSWKNLLPSCAFCNASKGKKTQFPVTGKYAGPFVAAGTPLPDETQLDALEEPLLLHACRGDDPRRHLVFGVKGEISAVDQSEKGTASINVFDLAAEELRIDRQRAQEKAELEFLTELLDAARRSRDRREAADGFVAEIERGRDAYSAAVADHIRSVRRSLAP